MPSKFPTIEVSFVFNSSKSKFNSSKSKFNSSKSKFNSFKSKFNSWDEGLEKHFSIGNNLRYVL